MKAHGNKGREFTEEHRRKISNALTGLKTPQETRKKMSETHRRLGSIRRLPPMKGDKNPMWKGDVAGYRSKHLWVVNNYGQPTTCEHCQTGNLTGHLIHWANKSGEHKRDRLDWLRLCVKCHKLFDTQKKHAN